MKKAQGLSMTTIIVAALTIIVLVVLVAIFTGKIGTFGGNIDETLGEFKNKCQLPGTNFRRCVNTTSCGPDTDYGGLIVLGNHDCPTGEVCCEY